MFRKFATHIRTTAIISLVLVLAISMAWATSTYSNRRTYAVGDGGNIRLVKSSDPILFYVYPGSLDSYLAEKDLNEVEITAEMTEELVKCASHTHYHLYFTFGPSGLYFDKANPAKLTINGKYVTTGPDCHVWLFDEDGEAVSGTLKVDEGRVVFEIPHFSHYSYEQYDY